MASLAESGQQTPIVVSHSPRASEFIRQEMILVGVFQVIDKFRRGYCDTI